MAKEKSPVSRFSMLVSPTRSQTLGYWQPGLETNGAGWTSQTYRVHSENLSIAKKYHDANSALAAAQQANKPPPDLGDLVTRRQRAQADYKKLAELAGKLQSIDEEVTRKAASLSPYSYNDSLRESQIRMEMRAHMRTMSDEKRMEALRSPEWKKAALEAPAELSNVSSVYHRALYEQELKAKFPDAIEGISQARAAIATAITGLDATSAALENELRVTSGVEPGPPPAVSESWTKED
jgi:hypothetical protein